MTDPLVVISGGIATALATVLGFFGTRKGQRAQESVAFTDQVREWATQLQESEEKCRLELAAVRRELEDLRRKLDRIASRVSDIEPEE